MSKIINLKNVTKIKKKKKILNDINMVIEDGNVVVLKGPNGSGKSTILNIILGFTTPTQGQVLIDQSQLRKNSLFAQNTGFSTQSSRPLKNLTGRENIELVNQLSDKQNLSENYVNDLLTSVGLDAKDSEKVHNYSLGMEQRLSLAMSLVANPRIVIWDEPENALDDSGEAMLRDLVKDGVATGKTFVIATHDSKIFATLTDEVIELNEGKIVNRVKNEKT